MSKWDLPKEPKFYEWKSPIIEIFKQAEENYQKQLNNKLEEQLMCEVNYQVGYSVDKEELIKALNYDREQYDKGYRDGVKETFIAELENIKTELNDKSFAYSLTDNFENDIVIGVIKVSDIEKILDNHISELKGE